MNTSLRIRIEVECLRLCREFFVYSDRGEASAYAALYTEDGKFILPWRTCTGREELMASIRNRPPNLIMRHLGINAAIDVVDETRATGRGSHMVFIYDRDSGRVGDPQIGDFVDNYVLSTDGWRIASRVVSLAFPD